MKRETDWVVAADMWSWDFNNMITLSADAQVLAPMMLWESQSLASSEYFESANSLVVERVKGQILWHIPDEPDSEANEYAVLDMRMRIGDSEPAIGGAPVLPTALDLANPLSANESFLWHHTWHMRTWGSWWGGAAGVTGWHGSVDVDCRVKRRLEPHFQLQFMAAWNRYATEGNQYRIALLMRLRVLLSEGGR